MGGGLHQRTPLGFWCCSPDNSYHPIIQQGVHNIKKEVNNIDVKQSRELHPLVDKQKEIV